MGACKPAFSMLLSSQNKFGRKSVQHKTGGIVELEAMVT